MMRRHQMSSYRDNHAEISFCSACGAEGLELFADCFYFDPMTQEEFDIKYGRIDENGLTKRNYRYKY